MVHDELTDGEITLRTLLEHMQANKSELMLEIKAVEDRLTKRIDSAEENLGRRLSAIESKDVGRRLMHVEDFVYSGIEPPGITVLTKPVMKEDVCI